MFSIAGMYFLVEAGIPARRWPEYTILISIVSDVFQLCSMIK